MRKNWKRILAGFLAACIIFGDSSLVYAAESSQNDADTSIVEEVSDEILDEEQMESAEEENTEEAVLEEDAVTDEETDVSENDAEVTGEDLSETTSEEIVVELSEEPVDAAATDLEVPTIDSEASADETETFQISAQQDVYVNPLYEDVVSEADILNSATAVMQVDESDIYTDDAEIVEMVRDGLVARNASITFAYEYDGTYDSGYVMDLLVASMEEAMEHTGNPVEGDYLRWNYSGYTYGISGGYAKDGIVHVEVYYSILYYTSAEMEAEVTEAVDVLMTDLQLEGMSEYDQIRSIYDYICENVTYDYEHLNDEGYKLKYTPYAALINGTSVCQGYATLFYRLALEADLDARVISGDAGGAHAWNIVRLYGSYYNMDATWDAPRAENGYDYKYFLQNMDEFSDHVRAEEYLTDSFMEEYSMAEASYVEEEEKLPMPDLRFYYDEEDELTGIAVENVASEDAEIVYGLVDEYYLDDIENYGHPASTFIIQSDDIYTISLETLTIFALMDGWDVDATYYLYAHLEDSEGNIISDINVMDSYPVTIGERNVMEEVSVRVSEDGNSCYYNDITEKEYAQLLAIISHENEYGLTTSCYAAPREKGVFYFNKEDFIKAYGEDYLTETIYATGYSLGDGIASGMNLFWDVVPVDADSYIVEEAQPNVSISLQTDEYGNAEAIVLSNDSSEILDLGLCAITEDEENYRYLASSEVAAGETVTYYLNDYADTFDDAEPGTYHLYTYAIDPETYEESTYVALEDFTLEVSRENADPVIAAVDDSTGIWHFTEYALDEYVDAQIFMGRTLANIWSIEVGEDTEVSDYFYLDIDQILDDMGWSGYEIENILFIKTVAETNCYQIQQYEGTEFEFTTYENGSEDEEEPDDDVDDNVFVLNKVYSTGSSDDWQDLYYTYYFTPEDSGYYGVKGDLFSIYVCKDNWDNEDIAYLKQTEDGNLEKYFYLEEGETYIFQLNIEVDAYEEEYYQLVMDTEGENLPVLTVSGEPYFVGAGKESVFRIQVSEAGPYYVAVDGYDYYMQCEEVVGYNDFATGDTIYFGEPGFAYYRIETEEDVTIELKAMDPQPLELDEEVTVQADTDICYKVDVSDHNIVYLLKNTGGFELLGEDAEGAGRYIESYWISENDEQCTILKTPSYITTLFIFFEGKYQSEDETMVVSSSYQFENQLTDWSGTITVPANADVVFEYTGDVYGDYFISEPLEGSWDDAWFESLCEDGEIRALWGTEELDGKAYKGYSYRYYDSEKEMKSHMIFKIYNYTNKELIFELKTNEDFEVWELYDEGDGHTGVELNYNYLDNDYSSYFSYYTFTPESTKMYSFHDCNWIYRLSDHRLMPDYNVVLEAGETYLIRFRDTYGMEDINVVQQNGSEVRFSLDEKIAAFTPDVSGDYYIEVPGTLKLWNAETLTFDNITTQSKIALEAGETYIFWSRRGEGQIGIKSEITVLDYDYYHALIASGGSVSIVDGELQIKEPSFGGFTLKEALLSLLGLGTYGNQPREAFMKANQYWVGESGTFASSEYYKLSEEGTLVDCAEDTVCAGDILVVKYEPEIVWVDSMKITADSTELYEGQSAQLSVEVAPATDKYGFKETPELRFESSDPEIADVDENGVVTPYRPGTVTITVYADETLRWREGLRNQILSESIELTVTGKQFTVLDYDYLQAFIASGGSVSLDADGSLKIEQKKAGWKLISMLASFFGISTYEEIPEETYIESNYYWLTEENESFVPVGYYDLDGNDISREQAEAGGYAVVKYEPEYVWVDHFDMEVEDDILTAGETTILTVTPYAATEKYGFKDTPEIRLESTNPGIADVLEDGTIETYKAGTVLIKAYADETLKYGMGLGHTIVSDYVVITVEPQPGTFTYDVLDDGTVSINGYDGEIPDKLVIPSQIDGYTVSAIGEFAFEVNEYEDYAGVNLTEVVLPNTITSIGFSSFQYCTNLKTINIPNSVEYIDNAAFSHCSSLESLVLPEGITNVGTFAFWNCTSLTELVIPKSLTTVQWGAFYQCSNLEKVTILGDQVTIEQNAFRECGRLEEVSIQGSLTTIDNYVFCNCTSLKTIELSDSVEYIGDFVFSQGYPEEDIDEYFENMDITIYASRRSYAYSWAIDNGFAVVDTEEEPYGFYYEFTDEEEIEITIIGFDNGTATGNLVIPETIDGYKVVGISGLAAENINGVFEGTLILPSSLKSIYADTFKGHSALKGTVVIPAGVDYIGENAFAGCDNLTIKVQCAEESFLYDWAIENGYDYELVAYACDNFVYEILKDETAKIIDYKNFSGDTLTIPEKLDGYAVSEIGESAFVNCTDLCELRIECEETLRIIGKNAFRGCTNLWTFEIPENVTSIGEGAFYGTGDWWDLEIPESVTTIGKEAFSSLSSIYRVYLTDNVTSIGSDAFGSRYYNEDSKEKTTIYCAKGSYAYEWASQNGYTIYDTTAKREYELTYTVLSEEEKTAAITGYTGEAGGVLKIPAEIDGYTITEIADCAFDAENGAEDHGLYRDSINFTGLELPDTLVRIGIQAFQSCKGLTGNLVLPKNLEEIDGCAFYGCKNLSGALVIPDSVKTVNYGAFHHCTGFTSLLLGKGLSTIDMGVFTQCRGLSGKLVIPENITRIADSAFTSCFGLNEVHMPDSVETIEGMCFYDEMTGEPLDITVYASRKSYPYQWAKEYGFKTVDTIADQYFFTYEDFGNQNIRITGIDGEAKGDLIIPETIGEFTVTAIEENAFVNCTGFEGKLEIPNTVTYIGQNAFRGCTGLTGTVLIPENVEEIYDYAFFNCTGLEKVYIPERTSWIADTAFMYDLTGEPGDENEEKLLDILVICDKGSYAYDWARNLGYQIDTETALAVRFTYEVLENGTARITKYNGMSYTDMLLPSVLDGYTVSEIGDDAFADCSEIYGTLSFPDEITKIGEGAFAGCTGLYRVDLPDDLQYLGDHAFFGMTELSKVFMDEDVVSIGDHAFSTYDENEEIINQELTIYCETGTYAYEWATTHGFNVFDFNLSGDYKLTYDVLDDGTICVTGYDGTPGKNLVIPQIIDGYTVTKIGASAFEYGFDFSGTLLLPNTLKEIDDYAFGACENISGTLVIPDSVERIGEDAFIDCLGLEEVHIGNRVTYIGDYAFLDSSYWDNLEITIHASRISYAYSWAMEKGFNTVDTDAGNAICLYEILDPELQTICITGIDGKPEKDFMIPQTIDGYTVTEIAPYAFSEADAEGKKFNGILTIPDTVTKIGEYAFEYCDGLTGDLVIPDSVTSIAEGAFWGCTGLENVYLQNALDTIGENAFSVDIRGEYRNLSITIYVSNKNYAYDWARMHGFAVELPGKQEKGFVYEILEDETVSIIAYSGMINEKIIIPSELGGYPVSEISDYAFANTFVWTDPMGKGWNLSTLIISEGIKRIGEKAFLNCDGIGGSLILPESLESLGESAFEGCNSIQELYLPKNLEEIPAAAFKHCDGIGDLLMMTQSVLTIGEDAFFGCDRLGRVYLSNNLTSIGDRAFSYQNTATTFKNLNARMYANAGTYAYDWATANGFETTNTLLSGKYEITYDVLDDGTACITGYSGTAGGDLIIPKEIDGYKVTEIGENAFWDERDFMGELILPDTLVKIGDGAFGFCSGLTGKLEIPGSVTIIGNEVFCENSFTGELVIPDSVTEIGSYVFYGCKKITSVKIGKGITVIPEQVFVDCIGLKTIEIPEQITEIEINAFGACSGLSGNLVIPGNVRKIGSGAFAYCRGLDGTLVIEDGVEIIGEAAFEGTRFTGELVIPDSVTEIGLYAFADTNFESLKIGKGLTTIPSGSFWGMDCLTGVLVIPEHVTTIEGDSFRMCTNITGVNIPDSVTYIDDYAFKDEEDGYEDHIITIYCNEGSYAHSWALAHNYPVAFEMSYSVTLVTNGGTILDGNITKYEEGVGAVLPTNVTKKGYTFEGWYADETFSGNRVYSIGKDEEGNKTFFAKWKAVNYKIDYELNGGTNDSKNPTDYTVEDAIVLYDPVREGYDFLGWYDENGNLVQRVEDLTGDQKIHAEWNPKDYDINYNGNGGTIKGDYVPSYDIESDTIVLPDIEKDHYEFDGWYTDEKYTEKVSVIPAGSTGDRTFYAKWKPIKYSISYEADGGLVEAGAAESYTIESADITLPTANKQGYRFDGWYENEEFTGNSVTVIPKGSTGNKTFYAKWVVNQYSIVFDTAGGSKIDMITQDYASKVTAPADPVREGYTFVGWDKEIPTTMPARNMTVTAQWKINQYTITFDAAGGSEIAAITQDYASEVTAPAAPAREGYTFVGWDKEIPATMPARNMTITAQWKINQYTITFDTAGGSPVASITADYGSMLSFFPPERPMKTGYTFVGWDKEIPIIMPAENITITAQWKINQYTITFDTAGGSEIAAITQDYASVVTAPAEPVREGYTFIGWDKEIPTTMPARDMTVIAQWKINEYTITFDTAGGSEIASITQGWGSEVTAPADPVKTGCTFVGWDKEIPTTMPAENITITALWELTNYTITYHVNGGTLSEDTVYPETFTVEGGVELPAPIRYGYQFAGWYTDEAFTEDTKVDTIPAGIADNLNVYAKWEFAAKLSLKLNNDGSVITHPYNKATKEWNYKDVTYTIETDTEGILINKDYYNAEEGYSVVAELYKVDADGTETLINIYYNTDQVIKAEDIDEQGDYLLTGTYRHPGEEVKEMTPVTFTVDYEKREYPVNKDLEWYGLSGNEERDQFGEIKPLLLELMQPTEDVLNSTIGEELVEDGTIVIKNAKNKEVKDTDALASGTYQVIYQIEHERFLEEAAANVIISYGTITADSVRYAAIDTEEELDDMGRTAGSTIAFEEDYVNSTQYTTGVVIVPIFKTPWGVLAANELEEVLNEKGYEGYTVSIEEVTETAKKEILELEPICFQGSSNATACAVTGTAKGKSSLKISTVIWDADDNQVTEITTNVKTITVVEGNANIVSEITLDLYDDLENYVDAYSESEDGVKTYLFAKDDRARSYSFELCAFTYAGDDASDAVFKWKSSSSIASVKTGKDGVTSLIIPKNAQGVADITVTANDSGKKAQIIKIVIVDAGMRLDTTSLTMNSLRPDSQQAVADLYPNVLAAEVNGMTVEDLFTNIGLYAKKDLDAVSEIFETDYDYETGELKIFFADSYLEELQSQTKTAAKTHTVYVGVESSLEDAEPEFYKLTIKDQCALPKKPTLKLTKNYEAAYASGYAEYTLTLNAPAAMRDDGETPAIWIDEDQKFEIFEWEDLSDGNGTSWKLKVRAKDYTVLPDAKKNAKTTKGINFNVEYDEYIKGHTVTVSITVKKSIPKFTVYGADTFTPVYYAETGYRYVNVVIPVEAGLVEGMITDGDYKELNVAENRAVIDNLLSISVKDKSRFELVKAEYFADYGTVPAKKGVTAVKEAFALTVKVVEPTGTKAKDAKLQFIVESDNVKNADGSNIQITTSALTVKSRKASSDAITVVNGQDAAVKSLTFNSTLAGKESITLYVNGSNELKSLSGLNEVKTVISVEGSDANSKKILKNNALLLSVDEENGEFTITSTSEAFKYSSCKLKVTMLLEGPEGTAATKNATVTLSFKKSLTPKVTLNAVKLYRGLEKYTEETDDVMTVNYLTDVTAVKAKVTNMPIGSFISNVRFADVADYSKYELFDFRMYDGGFQIGLSKYAQPVLGKDKVDVIYDITTATGDVISVKTTMNITVADSISMKVDTKSINLYNSAVGPAYGKDVTFSDAKGHAVEVLEIVNAEELAKAGIGIDLEQTSEDEKCGADTVRFFVDSELKRGKETTYTVKAKVALVDSVTEQDGTFVTTTAAEKIVTLKIVLKK